MGERAAPPTDGAALGQRLRPPAPGLVGVRVPATTLMSRVRHAFRQAPERSRGPPQPRNPRRGDDLPRDARGSPRAARGRRQLRRRPAVRRARPRARARPGRPEEPDAGPAGGEDRARGADGADGVRLLEARLLAAATHDDPPRRASGLGQDDRGGKARAPAEERRPQAGTRRRRPAASRCDRAADPARRAGRRSRLRRRALRPGQGGARRDRAGEGRRPRRGRSWTQRAACRSTRR